MTRVQRAPVSQQVLFVEEACCSLGWVFRCCGRLSCGKSCGCGAVVKQAAHGKTGQPRRGFRECDDARWVILIVPLLTACGSECDGSFLGSSATAPLVTADWPYGTGNAAGAWRLTLTPSTYGTSCVDLNSGYWPPELYAYTLEFPETGGAFLLYVEGVRLAEGGYQDEPESVDVADSVQYLSDTRVSTDRPEGKIVWQLEGEASLQPNPRSGTLIWAGFERIRVLESEDPTIRPGCTFSYDVSGYKVCDE